MDIENEKTTQIEKLDKLISEMSAKEKGMYFFLLNLKNTSNKIDELINNSLDLQMEISLCQGAIEMHTFKKKVIEYERLGHKLKVRLGVLPTFIIAYALFALIGYITLEVNIPKFIVDKLGVEAPEKLISLGIAGAFLYLATEFLTTQENNLGQYSKITSFLVRLSLAIIVTIVLVVLFFDSKGQVKDVSVSPELLSFCCGYSAKLVVGLFNKLVDKGSKMIDAI